MTIGAILMLFEAKIVKTKWYRDTSLNFAQFQSYMAHFKAKNISYKMVGVSLPFFSLESCEKRH